VHDPSNVKAVHVLTAWHLDIGFADTIANIVNRYLDTFYTDSAQVVPASPFFFATPISLYPSFLFFLLLSSSRAACGPMSLPPLMHGQKF
jgi:hypothetical protein